ncbi:MAG: nucleoside deaminase [Campylobacterales bacterium]|nr:nucleoside deaminase [Campylobacterales bacterium]
MALSIFDLECLHVALQEARKSYEEGGVPVGSAMSYQEHLIASGHNQRVQQDDPIAHGEMDCIRRAGRRPHYNGVTLYTTLSPCMMCSGTIVQFGIKRVVIGENRNFEGNIDFLRRNGVEVELVNDPECIELMDHFIREQPHLWNEDIAVTE